MPRLLAALLVLPVLLVLPLLQPRAHAQTGDPQAAKVLWDGAATQCRNCHGANGEGAFGPDLAGRKLTVAQFRQALRKPWGIMPTYLESQISDRDVVDLIAYFDGLPSASQPGPWRFDVPARAPRGQEALLATVGCGQCHGVTFNNPRATVGGINADFEWFKHMVYDHTTAMPDTWNLLGEKPAARVRMGNYSRSRLPESTLLEIWEFARDLGFRVPVAGQLGAGVASAAGITYTLNVENRGLPGKGLTAEDLTMTLVVPAGSTVVSTTGSGYQGVRRDEQAKASVAVWQVPRLAPKDRQTYSITLSRGGTAADNVRGSVSWTKPAVKTGPTDSVPVAAAPLPSATQ